MLFFTLVPGKPELTVKRIDSTSVRVSWNLKNGNEGIHYFLVTYYPLEDKFDRHIKNTTESAITIDGLQPDVVYQLVVSAWNKILFFQWTLLQKNLEELFQKVVDFMTKICLRIRISKKNGFHKHSLCKLYIISVTDKKTDIVLIVVLVIDCLW